MNAPRLASASVLFAAAAFAAILPFVRLRVGFAPGVLPDYLALDFGTTFLAVPFLVIIALVCAATAIWSLDGGKPRAAVPLALFALCMTAVLEAQSVLAFALCWEVMALVSVFLVASDHERRVVRRAAFSYMLVSQLGALGIVTALALLAVHAQSGHFSVLAASAATLPVPMRLAAMGFALFGFCSKGGLVPLHFWLPRAHPVAPAGASTLLSAVMLKIAVYGALLVLFVLAAPAPAIIGIVLVIIGALSAVLGALYAAIESELKRLLAYSSIENVGVIFAAIGLAAIAKAHGLPALAALALIAALFHSLNHAAFKGLLFLSAGTVVDRVHHVTDLDQLGGLAYGPLRYSAPFVLVGCLAASALPPLNGFASEWLVLRGFVSAIPGGSIGIAALAIAAIAALATAGGLAAAAFVKLYGTAFLGMSRHERVATPEPWNAAVTAVAVLAVACLVLGIAPVIALQPFAILAGALTGVAVPIPATVSWLPALALLPILGGFASFALARRAQRVPTWTCGSPVTARSQYSATTLSKPLRLIFGFVLIPERRRVVETGASPWVPVRILYETSTRYVVDEAARWTAAVIQRFSRRTRLVQGGRLRVYLTYALVAFALMIVLAR
jgi:hydrogenase-4 component B